MRKLLSVQVHTRTFKLEHFFDIYIDGKGKVVTVMFHDEVLFNE